MASPYEKDGLKLSKKFVWRHTIDLTDLDYMNIVGNAAWLLILQKARGDLLAQVGYPLPELFADGIGGVVNEARVVYIRTGQFMDVARVETEVLGPYETSVVLKHRVINDKTNKLMVKADLTIVFVDAKTNRGIKIPERVVEGIWGSGILGK